MQYLEGQFSTIFFKYGKYFQEHLNFKKVQHTVSVSRDHKKEVLEHMMTGFALLRIFQKEGSFIPNDHCSKLVVVFLMIKSFFFFVSKMLFFQKNFKSLQFHSDMESLHILFGFLLLMKNTWRKKSSF